MSALTHDFLGKALEVWRVLGHLLYNGLYGR
jgi:hypothetical protein